MVFRTFLLAPYHWFKNIVSLRETHPLSFQALFGIVCFVSLARAELEVLTSRTIQITAITILNNVAFYLQSAYLYALIANWLTRKSLDRVLGIVALGVFLGVFPPIFDVLLGGVDSGRYLYVVDGFSSWRWTLVNPKHYSLGEAVTLWILTVVLALYVFHVTRSSIRGLVALCISYATVVFIALGPSTFVYRLLENASPFPSGAWLFVLTLVQLGIAQVAYLCVRKSVAKRLSKRLIHGMPFIALTVLGNATADLFSPSGLSHTERARLSILTAWLIFELCLIALVQNDAYDAEMDRRSHASVTRDDAHFFSVTGIIMVLTTLYALPGLGTPAAMFFCVSILYSYNFYRSKRFFPANYKTEGIWGWSSFILGGSAQLSLAPTRSVSPTFLLASFFVFGGWSIFNVFKDYKDIREDYKARNQTLYVLALKRGIRLRKLHNGLRSAFLAGLILSAIALDRAGISRFGLILVTACFGLLLTWILGGPPRKRTIILFLGGITAYVLALTFLIELKLRSG